MHSLVAGSTIAGLPARAAEIQYVATRTVTQIGSPSLLHITDQFSVGDPAIVALEIGSRLLSRSRVAKSRPALTFQQQRDPRSEHQGPKEWAKTE